jgi:N-acetyltransferase
MSNGTNLRDEKGKVLVKTTKVQSVFNLASDKKPVHCSLCGVSYHKHQLKEVEVHKKYHNEYVNGIKWPRMDCMTLKTISIKNSKKKMLASTVQVKIILIDKSSKKQVQKTEQLLTMVNKELSAPVDSQLWKDPKSSKSKAFILVIKDRGVGMCTTDEIVNAEAQARWMIHGNQAVVPRQVNNQIKIGISRIWVAPAWRRLGLAQLLLEIVQSETDYGIKLKPQEIAFSQPSTTGGLLAQNFNGVKHKSGEILIPVYIE